MTQTAETNISTWTTQRAIVVASVSLMLGIAGGYFIRGAEIRSTAPVAAVTAPAAAPSGNASLKQQADTQAAPLLEKLKADPNHFETLVGLGNLYYDAQQYPTAVEYYGRALGAKPSDVSVRTDMGTAYWYMGNADLAITEFDRALTYDSNNANTLFNRGLVEWEGKKNAAAALADWNKLLAANPNYDQKDKVQQMIAKVQQANSR